MSGAREGGGEARDGSKRASVGDAFTTEDKLSVSTQGQSLAGGWLRARARGCSHEFRPLKEALASGLVNRFAQLTAVMNGVADGTILAGPRVKLRRWDGVKNGCGDGCPCYKLLLYAPGGAWRAKCQSKRWWCS
jgi:hypothetical protein